MSTAANKNHYFYLNEHKIVLQSRVCDREANFNPGRLTGDGEGWRGWVYYVLRPTQEG